MNIQHDDYIAPAHLHQADAETIDQQVARLIDDIQLNSDAQLDVFCDGAELDRERSAYESAELHHAFELLALRTKELLDEASQLGYLLAVTVSHQRSVAAIAAQLDDDTCEHGLSASLCYGPAHYASPDEIRQGW